MQIGVFLFGNVDMPDAGYGGTEPQDRRYGQADFVKQYDDCFAYAGAAESLGYDAVWLTEHHFQHEGYEVVPNILLLSAMVAMKTERIKLGGMFHVIPQWHPLRFAEDFALADVVSRGRMLCGIGRGTGPARACAGHRAGRPVTRRGGRSGTLRHRGPPGDDPRLARSHPKLARGAQPRFELARRGRPHPAIGHLTDFGGSLPLTYQTA